MIVAPIWLLISSPIIGIFFSSKRFAQDLLDAMKTGIQLIKLTPVFRHASA